MQILLNLNKTKIIKNIKDVIIGVFVVIGFAAIVTGFTNEAEQEPTYGTPKSHVRGFHINNGSVSTALDAFAINKQER